MNLFGSVYRYIIAAAVCFCRLEAEELFFHRDHHDQPMYSQKSIPGGFRGVNTEPQLIEYLNKYGYMICTMPLEDISLEDLRMRRDVQTVFRELDPIPSEDTSKRICDQSMIETALLSLQNSLGILETGKLDTETVRLLNSDRCGNTYIEMHHDYTTSGQTYTTPERNTPDNAAEGLTSPDNTANYFPYDITKPVETKRSRPKRYARSPVATVEELVHDTASRRSAQFSEIREELSANAEAIRLLHRRHRKRYYRVRRSSPMIENNVILDSNGNPVAKFKQYENRPITWRLLAAGYSKRFPIIDQIAMLELAFRMWSEVAPLRFKRQDSGHINDVDVHIVFGEGKHLDCPKPFDGVGGEYAHSRIGFDMHFDDDENFKIRDYGNHGIYFVRVAVHEIGHVLGLGHNDKRDSIMFPVYQSSPGGMDLELGSYDRKSLQRIYGVCRGTFDIVFDWLRKKPALTAKDHPRYIFNTYFFRGDHYWMYENRANRTRFGDPLFIVNEWRGLPNQIDCCTQILLRIGSYEYDINTYFFKGEIYYLYDDEQDKVKPGYPRLISEDFGSSCNESIPNDLDAVYYDKRHDLMYFFKNKWVWSFKPNDIGSGCIEHKYLFTDLFPMAKGETDIVTGDVSQFFYSYAHRTLYVFVGETVYENVDYASGNNLLKKHSQWYHKWHDICDVTADT